MGNRKKALLVNPWIVDFAAYDFWLRPLGLLWIGAFLRQAGFDVDLIDCLDRTHKSLDTCGIRNKDDGTGPFLKTDIPKPAALSFVPRKYGRYGIPLEVFRAELDSKDAPDIILVTCSMTYWYPGAFEAIKILKECYPGVPVILGGRYATLCEDHAVSFSRAHKVFPGRPGQDFVKFVMSATGLKVDIPESFTHWPLPAHDLHPDKSSVAILTSAGCPFRCTYCVSGLLNKKFEQRNCSDIINEIRTAVEDIGVDHIAFYDDALMAGWDEVLGPALDHVIKSGYAVNFYTPNAMHARYITREAAEKMKRAGFSHLRIGYESSDGKFQRDTGGKVDAQQFETAVRNLLAAGFRGNQVGAYILFGHPDQDADAIRNAMRSASDLGVEPVFSEYSPIPGSSDFAKAVSSFRHNPSEDPLLHNSSIILYQHPAISRSEFETMKNECNELRKKTRNNRG